MNRKSVIISTVLFVFMPILALLRVVFNYRLPETKNIIWFFTIFYGFTFIVLNNNKDSDRYSHEFVNMAHDRYITFEEFTGLLYNEETRYVDVVQPFISFVVSRVTDSPRILFAVFGLVFGFFYSRNVGCLLSKIKHKLRWEAVPFLVLFALLIAIWQINGFRFWTAAHVFIYGVFHLVEGRKVKGFIISFSSIFIHFSFLLPLIVLFVYLLAGNRLVFYFILYFASFFIVQVSPNSFSTYTSQLPPVFKERTESYLNEEYLEMRNKDKNLNWYVNGRGLFLKFALTALLIVVFLRYRAVIRANKVLVGTLSFGLLLSSVTTILNTIPSMERFFFVANMFILASLFILIQMQRRTTFKWWVRLPFIASFILYSVVEIRIGFDSMGIMTIIGNPITTLFVEDDTPLIKYIK